MSSSVRKGQATGGGGNAIVGACVSVIDDDAVCSDGKPCKDGKPCGDGNAGAVVTVINGGCSGAIDGVEERNAEVPVMDVAEGKAIPRPVAAE